MATTHETVGLLLGSLILLFVIFNYRKFSGIQSETRLNLRQRKALSDASQNPQLHVIDPATAAESDLGGKSKNLNVLFMYNGHSFDAHEIFGIPPGSSLQSIEQAYKKLKAKSPPEASKFLDTAYAVLQQELRSQKR